MSEEAAKTFFSYASEDSDFVSRLVKELREAGARVWLDKTDIAPGKHWDSEVEKALRECPIHVTVLSPDSVKSTEVMNEVNYALKNGKRVIPLLYRDCEIPFRLERVQHIDFRGDYHSALSELRNALVPHKVPGVILDLFGISESPLRASFSGAVPGSQTLTRKPADEAKPGMSVIPCEDLGYAHLYFYKRDWEVRGRRADGILSRDTLRQYLDKKFSERAERQRLRLGTNSIDDEIEETRRILKALEEGKADAVDYLSDQLKALPHGSIGLAVEILNLDEVIEATAGEITQKMVDKARKRYYGLSDREKRQATLGAIDALAKNIGLR